MHCGYWNIKSNGNGKEWLRATSEVMTQLLFSSAYTGRRGSVIFSLSYLHFLVLNFVIYGQNLSFSFLV